MVSSKLFYTLYTTHQLNSDHYSIIPLSIANLFYSLSPFPVIQNIFSSVLIIFGQLLLEFTNFDFNLYFIHKICVDTIFLLLVESEYLCFQSLVITFINGRLNIVKVLERALYAVKTSPNIENIERDVDVNIVEL